MSMQAYVARRTEIDVNSTTTGNQFDSTIAHLPKGGYVVAWTDQSGVNDDRSGRAILAQIFDAKGHKIGGEIPVNTTTAGEQLQPSVTVLKSGNFVVAWTDGSDADGANGYDIRAQMFDKTGEPIRGEFVVNKVTTLTQSDATLTALDDGGFVAVWQSNADRASGYDYSVHAQFFNSKGKLVGKELTLDDGSHPGAEDAAVTKLDDGSLLATWTRTDGGRGHIEAQRISASGKLIGENFSIDDEAHGSAQHSSVTALSGGGFIVTWDSLEPRGISARLFSASGKPLGASLIVDDVYGDYASPAVTQLQGGNIVVAYQTSHGTIVAQVLDEHGVKIGGELPLNLHATDPVLVEVLADKGGGFTVTWTDLGGQDGSGAGVHARIVDLDETVHVLTGTADGETLTAPTTAQWHLQGLAGDDTLVGERYGDTLDGGAGADRMEGGAGNDRYIVDNAGDTVVEADDRGFDTVVSTLGSYTLPDFVEALELGGKKNIAGTGNDAANTLTGNAGNNHLDGGRGDDHLLGGDGRDVLLGNVGDDHVEGGKGNDQLLGGSGDDLLSGGSGDDALQGEIGNDRLDGGSGDDRMMGGAGDDVYKVDATKDAVVEKADQGHDRVESTVSWTLGADVEDLTLTGSKGLSGTGNGDANKILGGKGDDVLKGLGGADILDGGAGQDVLTGGSGKDHFAFDDGDSGATAKTADRITDFAHGDRIDLSAIDAKAGGKDNGFNFIGDDAFTGHKGELHFAVVGHDSVVSGDVDGDKVADFMIQVDGVTSLHAGDFVL